MANGFPGVAVDARRPGNPLGRPYDVQRRIAPQQRKGDRMAHPANHDKMGHNQSGVLANRAADKKIKHRPHGSGVTRAML